MKLKFWKSKNTEPKRAPNYTCSSFGHDYFDTELARRAKEHKERNKGKKMKQIRTERKPYCSFMNGDCIQEKCVAFAYSVPLSEYERASLLMSDIPIVDGYKHNWCLKYNCSTANIYVIEDVEV